METEHLDELRKIRARLIILKNLYDDIEPELETALQALEEALRRNGYAV